MHNINFRFGDGYEGWKDAGLFDGIIITAAPTEIPRKLLEQLELGGRMIVPVGNSENQQLICITNNDGEYKEQIIEPVKFVPLLAGSIKS